MDTSLLITILLVAAVPIGVFAVVLLVLRRVAAQAERRADELRADVARRGERWLIPLQGASYRGIGGKPGRVKGGGVLGLTDRRLLFEPVAGERIALPLTRLVAADTSRWFGGGARAGKLHLVIELDDGSCLGFFVRDEQEWLRELAEAGVPDKSRVKADAEV